MSFQSLKGQTLGQFELRELIGAGGMGAVYLGYQPNLNRSVAVKVLLTHLVDEEGYIERFNREAQIAAALEHPHIIPIIDFGTQRGINYVVMRLLRGGTLAERVKQRQSTAQQLLSLGEIADLLRQVGSALDYAHAQGVIHRDIKPSNIMFDDQGTAFLVDFGIAKPMNTALEGLTAPGTSMGTIAYMSPEQWRGETLTAAIDQYAMGLVVYTLLTGRPAFEAPPNAPYAMMNKHVNEMPIPVHEVRPDIPQEVSAVIERSIAKKATDRFPTVTEMSKAFDRSIRGSSGVPTGFFTFQLPKKPSLMAALPPQAATPTPLLNKAPSEIAQPKPPPPPPRADDRTNVGAAGDATNPYLGDVASAVRDAVRQQNTTNNPPVHMGTYDEPKRSRRSVLIAAILVAILVVGGLIFLLLSQQGQALNTDQAVSTLMAGTSTAAYEQTAVVVALNVTQTLDSITKTVTSLQPTLDPTDAALSAEGTKLSALATNNSARASGIPTNAESTSEPTSATTEAAATGTNTPESGAVVILPTFTFTPSATFTATLTPTATATATLTLTNTITPSPTFTATLNAVEETALALSTQIAGETQTATFWTQTPTPSNTFTPTATFTPSNTATFTPTPTVTFTFTPTATFTETPTATFTATFTPTPQPIGLGEFDFDRPVPGTGWKMPEKDGNGQTIVWSDGPSAVLRLTLPSADTLLAFKINYAQPNTLLPVLIDHLRLSVGGQPVPFYQRTADSGTENVALIRGETIAALGGDVPLAFLLEDSSQTGTLAFAMNSLRVENESIAELPLRLDFDVPVPGIHWYAPEKPATTTYQWMHGASASILLHLPSDNELRLQFRALAEDQDQLNGLTMTVNGDPITLQPGRREGSKVSNATAFIPVATLKKSIGFTVITFEVPKAITIDPDPRSFGARFDYLIIDQRP